ncbi:hypothetical protein FPQ18DRAFT_389622 [Pyronema domesticum]|nr:hypothetical protein FPQ18DRAFT_389622 [Pyronema domesticum]
MVSPGTSNPIGMMAQNGAKPNDLASFIRAFASHAPDVDLHATQEQNGTVIFYTGANATTGGEVAKVEQVHADVLSAKVEAEVQTVWDAVPVYAGAGASANLVDMEAGPFTGTLGAGVDSEVGYKDQSVGFKVLGSGVRVERVCEISVFGSKIGIDWGKLF